MQRRLLGFIMHNNEYLLELQMVINNLLEGLLPNLPVGIMKDSKVAFPRLQI